MLENVISKLFKHALPKNSSFIYLTLKSFPIFWIQTRVAFNLLP
uniref:Uncharacterized protein n=1 Tax=Manihot esculenta TaxID=3983 RepID=A0A2C9VAE8_MANES